MAYDSRFEEELHKTVCKGCNHHPARISYVTEHTYEPDFQKGNTLIEAKGRFWPGDTAKYKWVRKSLKKNQTLVFLFMNPKIPLPGSRKRKNGTRMTHGEWATKNGFKFYTKENCPKHWRK